MNTVVIYDPVTGRINDIVHDAQNIEIIPETQEIRHAEGSFIGVQSAFMIVSGVKVPHDLKLMDFNLYQYDQTIVFVKWDEIEILKNELGQIKKDLAETRKDLAETRRALNNGAIERDFRS